MTTATDADPGLAASGAKAIDAGFSTYSASFREITRRAARRFEDMDWRGALDDATERLDVYTSTVRSVVAELENTYGPSIKDPVLWASTKDAYASLLEGRPDRELSETFYNSVTRKVFATVGVDRRIEFVFAEAPPAERARGPYRSFQVAGDLDEAIREAMVELAPPGGLDDPDRDAALVARKVAAEIGTTPAALEFLEAVFYRRKGAYLVGRVRGGEDPLAPLVIALSRDGGGTAVDAVLTDPNDVSILFSFTRSHFHVDLRPARSVVSFLSSLMPAKRRAELYIAIGHHKHGKTELYRDLMRHIHSTEEVFVTAPGTPGLVMITFTMPGYDLVLKVIRDRFPPQKQVTPRGVRRKYRLVFRHDRAGRLVEAQEFEHLRLRRERFSDNLLDDLLTEAGRTVRMEGAHIVIGHAYIERRVTPLDLHLARSGRREAERAVIDYGAAIEELAKTGVFPGDLLLKNFGVTRHGRVVSYDYDELSLLQDVEFRNFPRPSTQDEEMAAEPWFGVGKDDVFPSEFRAFLGLNGSLREVFEERWDQFFEVDFWQGAKRRLAAGEIFDITPYPEERRLMRGGS